MYLSDLKGILRHYGDGRHPIRMSMMLSRAIIYAEENRTDLFSCSYAQAIRFQERSSLQEHRFRPQLFVSVRIEAVASPLDKSTARNGRVD